MDEPAAVRRMTGEAIADVTPAPLRETITGVLEQGSPVPGVVTLLVGRAVAASHGLDGTAGMAADPDTGADAAVDTDAATATSVDADGLHERAAGVQLIYDGLRLTRRLAAEEPWTIDAAAADRGDMAVLAADVLVARGFYLLARSAAAGAAVDVVRSFGTDQSADPPAPGLEADILELALAAGADGRPVPGAAERLAASITERTTPPEPSTDGEAGSTVRVFPTIETILVDADAACLRETAASVSESGSGSESGSSADPGEVRADR